MPGEAVQPLACPTCARRFELSESFCPACAMPLVYVGRGDEEPITATHERAGKVDPRYTGGELVKAAFARNQAEAELIQGILLEEGIPSVEPAASTSPTFSPPGPATSSSRVRPTSPPGSCSPAAATVSSSPGPPNSAPCGCSPGCWSRSRSPR
jgi:hypothetical protein